jgi:N-acyl-L-homoserine lactone synthetase
LCALIVSNRRSGDRGDILPLPDEFRRTGAMVPSSPITLALATREPELTSVYRLRYRIYVEELRWTQHYADHIQRQIIDPLDNAAHQIVAWQNGRLVGFVRLNFCSEMDVGYYDQLCQMNQVADDHPRATSLCTRLMVIPHLRGSPLAVRLCSFCYAFALERGIKHNFIDTDDHLVPFFKRLGYVAHAPKAEHPEYGWVKPMHLNLHDKVHLVRVKSPFLLMFLRWERQLPEMTSA